MRSAATLTFGIASSIAMVWTGVAVASLVTPSSGSSPLRPMESDQLWVSKPVRIDTARQSLERLTPRFSSYVTDDERKTIELASLNPKSTSATLPVDSASETASAEDRNAMHTNDQSGGTVAQVSPEQLAWCGARYRSYDPQTNTYRAYSGEIRTCAFPGSANNPTEQAMAQKDAGGDPAHVAWCQSRYRSYDTGTDTYRSYSGAIRPCISPVSQ
ncbi:BA14K family protein [Rhizobium sp. PAMB 3174]